MRPRLAAKLLTVVLLVSVLAAQSGGPARGPRRADWAVYGGQAADMHYSPLTQIDRANVAQLRPAWSFDTGEEGGLETSPLEVGGVVYANTPTQKIIALDATSGRLLWKFDAGIASRAPDRGLAYWASPGGKDRRILAGVMNYLYALDAGTGRPISGFGDNGRIDLRDGLGRPPALQSIALTSPGVIYKNLIIVGGRESETLPASPGNIRAYDVRDGKLAWDFHTLPHPGDAGYRTWPKDAWQVVGAANNWAGMAVDTERSIVYAPTGSAAFDFYGADRVGQDHFADCLLALDAVSGKLLWYFQGVHHDLWDRDFPSPPTLVTVTRDGRAIAAVAQTTKQGVVYVFDRVTGRPLFPIVERPFPASTVPGEQAWPTQPWPLRPAPFARQRLSAALLTDRTPQAHAWALRQFKTFVSDGQFVPLGVGKETVVFPGFDGGAEWGGSAYDPAAHLLFVNSNDVAWTGSLAENRADMAAHGRSLYLNYCASCHQQNLAGAPPDFPSLVGLAMRRTPAAVAAQIRQGGGRMPGFPFLTPAQIDELVTYVSDPSAAHARSSGRKGQDRLAELPAPMPYRFTGYHKFLDPEGYPAVQPPWGTLNAINLDTGDYVWKIPLGYYPALAAQGRKNTGSENYGGPIVTASGVVFIAATNFDQQIRAFDERTGQLLWHAPLPFAGNSTPITYEVAGRQYVVIAAGGGKALKAKSEGVYVAFALPARPRDKDEKKGGEGRR